MNIGSLCTREVLTIDRAATLQRAAALMREHHVGSLVITAETERGPAVVGVVTDRDLVIEALARGVAQADVRIGQLVQGAPVTVGEDAGFGEALEHMQQQGVRRLLVTDADGQLAGIVSLDDIVAALAAELGVLAQVISAGREREAKARGTPLAPPPAPPRLHIPAMGTAGWPA